MKSKKLFARLTALTLCGGIATGACLLATTSCSQPTEILISTTDNTNVTYGTSITFSYSLANPEGDTVWNTTDLPAGVTFVDNGNGTVTYQNLDISYTTPTIFEVFATNNTVISNTIEVTFDNNPATTISISTTDSTTVAFGTSITFSSNIVNPSGATVWNTTNLPAGVTFVDNGNGTVTYTNNNASYTTPASFSVNATNHLTTSNSIAVTFNNNPATLISISTTDNPTVAFGSTITFSSSLVNPSGATVWNTTSLPTGVTFHDNSDGTATYTNNNASHTTPAPFSVYATNNSVVSSSIAVTFNNNPATTIAISTSDSTTVAFGGTITFSSSLANPSGATVWNTANLPAGVTFVDNGNGTVTYTNNNTSYTTPAPFSVSAVNNSVASNAIAVTFSNNPATYVGVATTSQNLNVKYDGSITFNYTVYNASGATVWNTTNLPAGVTSQASGNQIVYSNAMTDNASATFNVTATNNSVVSEAIQITFFPNGATSVSIVNESSSNTIAYGSSTILDAIVDNPEGDSDLVSLPFSLPAGITATRIDGNHYTITNQLVSATSQTIGFQYTNNGAMSDFLNLTFTPQDPSISISADNTTLDNSTTTANVTATFINVTNTCTYTITGVYTGGAIWTYGSDCQITTTSNSLVIVDQYEVNPSSGSHLFLTITAQTSSGLVSNQIQITLNGISGVAA